MTNDAEQIRAKAIYKVTWVGFFANLALTVFKLIAGILGRSAAMVADAVHSLSDFATDLAVLLFVRISSKPKDDDHHYGHGKFETLATVLIGLVLLGVAVGIFVKSTTTVYNVFFNNLQLQQPEWVALIAAAVSIACKEALYWYTVIVGQKVKSPAVIANAWHHRSDAFSSIGTLLGIGGAILLGQKWAVLDPIAAIVVSILIGNVAIKLCIPSLNELLEKSLPKEVEQEILNVISQHQAFKDPHNLKTRQIGANYAIEFHIRVDGQMNVHESHEETRKLEQALRDEFGSKTQVITHVEPIK